MATRVPSKDSVQNYSAKQSWRFSERIYFTDNLFTHKQTTDISHVAAAAAAERVTAASVINK